MLSHTSRGKGGGAKTNDIERMGISRVKVKGTGPRTCSSATSTTMNLTQSSGTQAPIERSQFLTAWAMTHMDNLIHNYFLPASPFVQPINCCNSEFKLVIFWHFQEPGRTTTFICVSSGMGNSLHLKTWEPDDKNPPVAKLLNSDQFIQHRLYTVYCCLHQIPNK
jgi:hypothetical protein